MQPIDWTDLPEETALGILMNYDDADQLPELWRDDDHLALVHRFGSGLDQLSVQRFDGEPVKGWDDLQRIKSAIYGPHVEAVELYPDEDRLVDMGNTRHLWIRTDGSRWPFGFDPLIPLVFDH
jgi:hypothetical protein